MATHYEETRYGFEWGSLAVNRLISDPKGGYLLEVRTPYRVLEIRVSPSGKVIETMLSAKARAK